MLALDAAWSSIIHHRLPAFSYGTGRALQLALRNQLKQHKLCVCTSVCVFLWGDTYCALAWCILMHTGFFCSWSCVCFVFWFCALKCLSVCVTGWVCVSLSVHSLCAFERPIISPSCIVRLQYWPLPDFFISLYLSVSSTCFLFLSLFMYPLFLSLPSIPLTISLSSSPIQPLNSFYFPLLLPLPLPSTSISFCLFTKLHNYILDIFILAHM